ncbi:hypothetical protein [Streptomyces marincola]|uniref:hypothetical protein n=1 Tax=Streptomyces marincola TaxID=2878388 RepID=UPI001CF34B90|nr:hypothetical protein [Streptomyces marincola]UCM89270.1 hypothetical protein LC193_15680 [Streptomyces marincola]
MPHCIAWILDPLLTWLFPPPGRHRATENDAVGDKTDRPTVVLPAVPGAASHEHVERTALVRPYLVAAEEQRERRLRRERRQALWFASHGIDVGAHRIHGIEVAS